MTSDQALGRLSHDRWLIRVDCIGKVEICVSYSKDFYFERSSSPCDRVIGILEVAQHLRDYIM